MRAGDVFGLALQAMRQRKVRTALTVVGVSIGCFVLITSLSVGQGVQEVILGQLRKQDQLRRIVVWPGGGKQGEVPPAELEVPGEMSEARRERLREAIRKRWQAPQRVAPPGLKPAQVEALEHLRVTGQPRVWPLFSEVDADVSMPVVTGFVAARVAQVGQDTDGGALRITLAPASMCTATAVTASCLGREHPTPACPYVCKIRLVE